jgi:TonB family protein
MKPTVRDAIPANEAGGARARRVDAYIISSDDGLLLELGPALGDRFRTRPIENMDELPSAARAPWIGFVDGARADARAWIQHIEKVHPQAVLIAIVDDADLQSWQGLVFRGGVCAAVGTQQIGTVALSDALTRAQLRLQQAAATAIHGEPLRPHPALPGTVMPGSRVAWFMPACIAAALIIVALGWWLLRGHSSPAPTAAAAATPATPDTARKAAPAPAVPVINVLEVLSTARSAFRDPDRQLPRSDAHQRGDSALELYAQVLAQEPTNAEARDGLRRLYTVGRSRMQSDLTAGRMDEAQRMLAIFRTAGIEPAALKAMEADVAAAQPRWLLSQARRALAANDVAAAEQYYAQLAALGADRITLQELRRGLDAHQADAQLQTLADEVHTAVVAGALLEPAASSARTRLQAMRQANRTHPATLAAQRELQDALLTRAREAQAATQYEAAQRWLAAAADIGASNDVTELRRLVQADMDRAATRAAAAATPPTPSPVAASAPAALATTPVPATPRYVGARPLRPLNVTYPTQAMQSRLQGYVVLEFTLNPDGHASDIQVVESSSPSVFDKAALDAVTRGRYDTAPLGDSHQPRTARLRVTFKPG